jgi:hypothetical protein
MEFPVTQKLLHIWAPAVDLPLDEWRKTWDHDDIASRC